MSDQGGRVVRAQGRKVPDDELPGPPGDPSAELEGGQASLWGDAWKQLRRNPTFIVASLLILLFMVMAFFPRLFTSANPRVCSLTRSLVRPSSEHIFGFDLQGCDYYARTIYGARVSVILGISVMVVAVLLAMVLGSLAGYYGGAVDGLIARVTDVWLAIPIVLGGIVVLTALRNVDEDANIILKGISTVTNGFDRITGIRGIGVVWFVLVVLGWPTMTRLMRSAVLSVKEADYVEAARALGANDLRIIVRHILPNAMAPVIVYATISVGVVIVAEATLSFLGVGLRLPAVSWGLMISGAQQRILTSPHLLFFPGTFLAVAVFSFILLGDALRDALDPRLR